MDAVSANVCGGDVTAGSDVSGSSRVSLKVTWAGGFATYGWVVAAAVLWAGVVAIAVAGGAWTVDSADEAEFYDRLVAIVVLAALVAIMAVGVSRTARRRLRQPPPALRLEEDHLVIVVPTLLERPLVVPVGEVAAALVDERRPSRVWQGVGRFPLGVDRGWEPVWLWRSPGGARLPVLAWMNDIPNVALLFTRSVRLPPEHQPSRWWRWGIGVHHEIGRPRLSDDAPGVLCRAVDADWARAVFRSAGLLEDAGSVEPSLLDDLSPSELRPPRQAAGGVSTSSVGRSFSRIAIGLVLLAVNLAVIVWLVRTAS